MRRRWTTWPAALVLLGLLAACVSIPTGGGVTTDQIDSSDTDVEGLINFMANEGQGSLT